MDKKKKQEDEAKTAKKKFTSEVNDCVKNVAQLDMRIQKIQSEMRRSNNKLAMMDIGKSSTTSTNSSSKVVGTNSLTSTAAVAPPAAAVVVDKEGAAEKTTPSMAKKVPVWRKDSDHTSKPSSFLEDNRFYLASQRHPIPAALRRNGTTSKSLDTDPIICELFGDDDVEEENAMIGTKKRRRKQSVDEVLPNTKVCPLGGSSTTNAMIKREKKRPKREEPNGDDECLRKERQAMVDSILEDESEKDEAAAAAAEETGPKSVLSAAFIKRGKRPLSRSPSIVSIQSSVSVVPETPPTSPRPATDRVQVLPQATNAATAAMLAQQPQQQRRVPSAEEQLHTRTVAALLASVDRKKDENAQHNHHNKTVANAVDMEWLTKPKEKSKKSSSSTLNNALRQPAPTVAAVSTTSAVAANNNYVPARVPMHHASQRPLAPKASAYILLIRQSDLDAGKSRIPFVDDSVLSRVCDRCGKEYRLTKGGEYAPGSSADQCIFHWGRAWKKRVSGTIESRYNCCDQPLTVQGCDVAPNHITQTQRLSTLRRYVETPRPFGVGDPRSKKVYALDCEMVYTVWGPEVARWV
uniref:Myb-like domain-containing protein n=1 Tax=Globodera pallida TaxID=36090 RepID=A0A183C0P9_GLOPA